MPYKIWAVGGEVLAADMNDYLQEQVVATFANAAARDAAITAPVAGQTAFLVDTAGLTIYQDPPGVAAAGWYPPWRSAWGVQIMAKVSSGHPGFSGTEGDISGMTVTWGAVAGRRYRLEVKAEYLVSIANAIFESKLTDAANVQLNRITGAISVAGAGFTFGLSHYEDAATTGNITRKMRLRVAAGGGTTNFEASATDPGFMVVEDVGPSGS
jgi:hypothetical protein